MSSHKSVLLVVSLHVSPRNPLSLSPPLHPDHHSPVVAMGGSEYLPPPFRTPAVHPPSTPAYGRVHAPLYGPNRVPEENSRLQNIMNDT